MTTLLNTELKMTNNTLKPYQKHSHLGHGHTINNQYSPTYHS